MEMMIFQDPIVGLEVGTLVVTLLYIARLMVVEMVHQGSTREMTRHPFAIFSVGSLVSLPKRSLDAQRVIRGAIF